ncbi:MAG TPA: GNAT family N-acetyltransferase [Chitinophagaceae bacterium]|nr:GNAT family N-acetyltransferase [Chitinophagaceae bacterium]
MQIIFETPRLILSRFTIADAPLIFLLNSDPEVLKYVHEPVLENEDHAKKIIENIILPQYKNNLGRWAVYTKNDNAFIGWCGLKHMPDPCIIDLGYRFLKNSWGKGYATEAARHTLQYGFRNLYIDIITGRAHIENVASQKVLKKIGMKYIRDELVDSCPVKTYIAIWRN